MPAEAEWEYANRAGTTTKYYWGNDLDREYTPMKLHPVGDTPVNPWGLHGMSSNTWEWCLDWYGEDYY